MAASDWRDSLESSTIRKRMGGRAKTAPIVPGLDALIKTCERRIMHAFRRQPTMKLFGGGKPDHPLADPKEAKRVLEALPANDPVKALDELMHWLESVAAVEGFRPEDRIELLFMLDEAAQPRVRKLTRDYF